MFVHEKQNKVQEKSYMYCVKNSISFEMKSKGQLCKLWKKIKLQKVCPGYLLEVLELFQPCKEFS